MRRLIVLLVVVLGLAVGCGEGATGGSAHGDEEVAAAAAVYPLAWVAEQVAPQADIALLTAGGLEAHDLDLTPEQRGAIETADVVLFAGDIGFQPQVEQAVASASGEVVSLAEVAGERVLAPLADRHAEEGEHTEEGEHAGEHGEEEAVDPHMWFDPEIMTDAAQRTWEAFAAADPDNAETYTQNAIAVGDELRALGADLNEILGGECRFDEAIVSHQAYGYLLRPYGYTQHAISGVSPEAGASSGELRELVDEVRREGIEYVLAEPVEGRGDAEAVAREAGVRLLEVSPLDAVTEEQTGLGLPDLVRQQARQFATALACRRP